MAKLKLFTSKNKSYVLIVPFARDSISDRAAGSSLSLSWDEFLQNGIQEINQLLKSFYDLDPNVPSDFYQVKSEAERDKVIGECYEFSISKKRRQANAQVWIWAKDDSIEIDFPIGDQLLQIIDDCYATPNKV